MIGQSGYRFYSVKALCETFGCSRQAFYKRSKVQPDEVELRITLVDQMLKCRKKYPTAGCRYVYDDMPKDWPWGRDKTEQALLKMGFAVRYPKNKIRTTKPGSRTYPNLIYGLQVSTINTVWQGDMTYFHTLDGQVNYLILLTDVYSQAIVGHGAYSSYPATSFLEVLQRAIKKRGGKNLKGLIHHSDRGSQYGSNLYANELGRYGILQSMCKYSWENPFAEKANDLIKNGYLENWAPKNLKELRLLLNRAINNHNKFKRKPKLDKLTPYGIESKLANDPYFKPIELTLKPTQQWDMVLTKTHKNGLSTKMESYESPLDPSFN